MGHVMDDYQPCFLPISWETVKKVPLWEAAFLFFYQPRQNKIVFNNF